MAVHAHPDDEVIPTGGLLAKCADEGITTVLVTCTDGAQGFGPNFVNSGEPGHEPSEVARTRLAELERSCEALGVTHLEMLGYGDSGMAGWSSNDEPGVFSRVDLNVAGERVAELIRKYRPQVLVTYADNGGSGHPDHVQAHRATLAADDATEIASKLYFVIRSESFAERVRIERDALAVELLKPNSGRPRQRPSLDHLVTTVIDTSSSITRRREALHAHRSQLDGSHWLHLDDEALARIFCEETYIRARDRTGTPLPEADLFAGLR